MYTRMLPVLIQVVCKVSTEEALDYSFPLSVALNSGLAEFYIQFYLQSRQDRSKAGSMIQQAPHESTVTDDRSKKVSWMNLCHMSDLLDLKDFLYRT